MYVYVFSYIWSIVVKIIWEDIIPCSTGLNKTTPVWIIWYLFIYIQKWIVQIIQFGKK